MFNHEKDERFLFVMLSLAEVSGQECTDFKVKLYANFLQDIPIGKIEKAVENIIKTRTFNSFPKVAEIREQICGGKPEDAAIIALDKVENAFRTVGAYRTVQFDDPIIHAVIEHFGGWPKLCSLGWDEWKFVRKDFAKAYAAFVSKPDSLLRLPERCAGIADTANAANGYRELSQIVQIGNIESRKQIEGGKDEQRTLDVTHQISKKLGVKKR